jgi:hypothetical protein
MGVVNEDCELMGMELADMLADGSGLAASPEARSRSGSNAAAARRRSPVPPLGDGDLLSEGLPSPSVHSMLAEASMPAPAPTLHVDDGGQPGGRHVRSMSALASIGRHAPSPASSMLTSHCSPSATLRPRPGSGANSTITVSTKKLQEIEDPILGMLHVLHKLMFVCEQPPTLKVTPARHVLRRFKQTLFGVNAAGDGDFGLAGEGMKLHLKRLAAGADVVATGIDFGPAALNVRQSIVEEKSMLTEQAAARRRRHREHSAADDDEEYGDAHALTYRQLRMALEHELGELGYYGGRLWESERSGSGAEDDPDLLA